MTDRHRGRLRLFSIPDVEKSASGSPVKVGEDTLLVLTNLGSLGAACTCIVLFGGQENLIVGGLTDLSLSDVDEINICSMLPTPPSSGGLTGGVVVLTVTGPCSAWSFNQQAGVYAWIKDVAYKGKKKDAANPFTANVVGIAKTELRVVPQPGVDNGALSGLCAGQPILPSTVYLDDTFQ